MCDSKKVILFDGTSLNGWKSPSARRRTGLLRTAL